MPKTKKPRRPEYHSYECKICADEKLGPCTAQADGILEPSVCIYTFRLARWRRMA